MTTKTTAKALIDLNLELPNTTTRMGTATSIADRAKSTIHMGTLSPMVARKRMMTKVTCGDCHSSCPPAAFLLFLCIYDGVTGAFYSRMDSGDWNWFAVYPGRF
jgi:hypothetical protein